MKRPRCGALIPKPPCAQYYIAPNKSQTVAFQPKKKPHEETTHTHAAATVTETTVEYGNQEGRWTMPAKQKITAYKYIYILYMNLKLLSLRSISFHFYLSTLFSELIPAVLWTLLVWCAYETPGYSLRCRLLRLSLPSSSTQSFSLLIMMNFKCNRPNHANAPTRMNSSLMNYWTVTMRLI